MSDTGSNNIQRYALHASRCCFSCFLSLTLTLSCTNWPHFCVAIQNQQLTAAATSLRAHNEELGMRNEALEEQRSQLQAKCDEQERELASQGRGAHGRDSPMLAQYSCLRAPLSVSNACINVSHTLCVFQDLFSLILCSHRTLCVSLT